MLDNLPLQQLSNSPPSYATNRFRLNVTNLAPAVESGTRRAMLRPAELMRAASISRPFSFTDWNRAQVRAIAPRRFFRVLPTLTRPSLFGSD